MSNIHYEPPATIANFMASEKFYNFIIGPVGSSKTTGILFKILYHAARQKPGPDGIRRTRWVVVRNTLPQLKDTTLNSFFTWFKPGEAGEWRVTDNKFIFKFDDIYAEVLFRPLDTADDVHRVLSLEVTGAILDEFVEIPKAIVEALSARCGRYPSAKDGGPTWWGMWGASNPGNEDDWWYNWLYEEKPENLGYFEQPSGFTPQAENIENLPGGHGYYHNLMVGKSAAWVKQFIEVKWGYSLRGKPVFRTFNPELHIARSPLIYNPHLPVVMGFDAGLTPAAIFGQQDSNGRVLVMRELVSENMGAKRFCREKVKPLLNSTFPHANLLVLADPAVSQRAQTDERSVKQVLEEELGVRVKPAYSNTLTDRLGAVEEYLTRLTEVGPAYLVDPSCKTLIRGFTSGYRYPVNQKGVTGDSPEKNFYSHCFVAGTLVATPTGSRAIERLMPGDVVLTHGGQQRVTATMNSEADATVEMVFSDGTSLRCTPDHPFITARGVVRADAVQYTDVLFSNKETPCTSSSRGLGSTANRAVTWLLRRVKTCVGRGTSTERCGYTTTALYRTDTMSTTSTMTGGTTPSVTSGVSPAKSTPPTTRGSGSTPATLPYCEVSKLHKKPRKRGTDPQRAASGTLCTVRRWLQACLTRSVRACIVGEHSPANGAKRSEGSAPPRANPLLGAPPGSITSREPARIAEGGSSATSTQSNRHVVRLAARRYLEQRVRVYDLTVESAHVFYANGILVSNCHDANQYMCMGFLRESQRDAQKRKGGFTIPRFANSYAF